MGNLYSASHNLGQGKPVSTYFHLVGETDREVKQFCLLGSRSTFNDSRSSVELTESISGPGLEETQPK